MAPQAISARTHVDQNGHRDWAGPENGLFQCLIVSASPGRRDAFAQAAGDSGWRVMVTGDTEQAHDSLARHLIQLSVVDLVGAETNQFQSLLEKLAGQAGVLLVVCGNEGAVREEIWVRQQGAWLYLTGIQDGSCIRALCHEARQIIEHLRNVSAEKDESLTHPARRSK